MNKYKNIIILIFINCTIVCFIFSSILKNINNTYFTSNGDGFKSYYCSLYHIKYDKHYLEFEGMNYPFGESIFYTDNQPLISTVLKFLNTFIPIENYTVGIINLLMLLSFIICPIVLYLLFSEFKIRNWISIPFSVLITLLSPQIGRMGGHFSLSYTFFIPLLVLLLLKYFNSYKWKYSLYIGILLIVVSFTHPYFFAIFGVIIVGVWVLNYILRHEFKKNLVNTWGHLVIQFILPSLAVFFISILADNFNNRTSFPTGFLASKASLISVFLPIEKSYGGLFINLINTKKIEWEGISYIGIVNLFVSVFLLITTFKSLRFIKLASNRDTFYFVISILILSVLLLIYSFGIPFIFGLESMINYLGPLRQLRAIGRFAWPFYYTISMITVLLLNHIFEIKINKYFKIIIFTGAVLISSFEAYSTNKVLGDWFNHEIYSLADIKNETSENAWISKINISDYQAIIPIPYFNIGSENFIVKNNDKIAEITFVASLKTGLPTTAVMMGRTSISQTIEQLQFMNKPSTIPMLLNKVNRSKAFLVISPKNKPITNTFEQSMLDNALLIDSSGSYCYYKLTYSGYLSLLENYKHDYILENDKNTETKHEFYYFNGFDTFKNNTPYYGRSSKKISFSTDGLIDNFTFPSIETDSAYEISFWYSNIAHDLVARSYLCVYIYDKQGSTLEYSFYCLGDYTSQFDGNWGRFSLKLKNKKTPNFVSLSLSNADDLKGDILVDNLLIKKASGIIFCHDRKEMIDNCLTLVVR